MQVKIRKRMIAHQKVDASFDFHLLNHFFLLTAAPHSLGNLMSHKGSFVGGRASRRRFVC